MHTAVYRNLHYPQLHFSWWQENKGENYGMIGFPAPTCNEVWSCIPLINLWPETARWTKECTVWGEPPPPLLIIHQGEALRPQGAGLTSRRSDAAVARWRHSCKDRTEVRGDTQRRVQREKQRGFKREKETKGRETHCLNEASGARKAELPNMVMLKQEAHVAACHPWASCVWWSWRSQVLSLEGDKPHIGRHKICYQAEFSAPLINRNWSELKTRNSGKILLRPLLQQEGVRTNNSFPCLLTQKPHFLVAQHVVFLQSPAVGVSKRTQGCLK